MSMDAAFEQDSWRLALKFKVYKVCPALARNSRYTMTPSDVGDESSLNTSRKLFAGTKPSRTTLNTLVTLDISVNLHLLSHRISNRIHYRDHVVNDEQSQGCLELRSQKQ